LGLEGRKPALRRKGSRVSQIAVEDTKEKSQMKAEVRGERQDEAVSRKKAGSHGAGIQGGRKMILSACKKREGVVKN